MRSHAGIADGEFVGAAATAPKVTGPVPAVSANRVALSDTVVPLVTEMH
jgi:hypothetical protein